MLEVEQDLIGDLTLGRGNRVSTGSLHGFFISVLWTEARAVCMLGKCPTIKLHLLPLTQQALWPKSITYGGELIASQRTTRVLK